jgi:hypothetical protein
MMEAEPEFLGLQLELARLYAECSCSLWLDHGNAQTSTQTESLKRNDTNAENRNNAA